MARFFIDGERHNVTATQTVYAGAQCDGCGQADGLLVEQGGQVLECPECGAEFYAEAA